MAGWWSMHLLVSIRSFSKQFYRKMVSFRWEWFIYDYNVAKHAKAHRGHSIWQIPLVRMDFVLFMPIVNKLQNAGASVRGTLYLTIIIQWQLVSNGKRIINIVGLSFFMVLQTFRLEKKKSIDTRIPFSIRVELSSLCIFSFVETRSAVAYFHSIWMSLLFKRFMIYELAVRVWWKYG